MAVSSWRDGYSFAANALNRSQRQNPPLARFQKLLPVLLVVLLGWYSLFFWQFSGATNSLGLWVTVILGIGLIIRQGISTGEQQFIQYASLVNSISEPAFVCDRDGRLRMVNPAFLRISGYDQAAEALGTRLQRLLDEESPLPPFSQVRKEGWSGEKELLARSGERIPVSLSLQPIQPGGDERLSLAGTAHDLRELKKQQRDLRLAYEQIASAHDELGKMNQQLAEKVAEETANLSVALSRLEKQNRELQKLDQLKSDFVSMVSHELRAPLTNINGGIELVLMKREQAASADQEFPGAGLRGDQPPDALCGNHPGYFRARCGQDAADDRAAADLSGGCHHPTPDDPPWKH